MNLSAIRQFAGLTQETLAEKMGTKQTTISRLERQGEWKLGTIAAYLHAAGIRASLVLEKDGEIMTLKLTKEGFVE